MCDHCGCAATGDRANHDHAAGHAHPAATAAGPRAVPVGRPLLEVNARLAEQNRGFFRARGIYVINLLSAPGAGKTALLERTLAAVGAELKIGVIVGDLQTENDAERLRRCGAPAVQILTGEACHLDAHMVAHALDRLPLDGLRLLFIENVGNLVCPALFDLGENERVVLMSVTEGEDKPQKYPVIFRYASRVLVTKTDLAAAAGFQRDLALEHLRRAAPQAELLEVSARTGQGMETWYARLRMAFNGRG